MLPSSLLTNRVLMCEIVLELAAWNSILRVARVKVRVWVGWVKANPKPYPCPNLNPTLATLLTRIKLNSKLQIPSQLHRL